MVSQGNNSTHLLLVVVVMVCLLNNGDRVVEAKTHLHKWDVRYEYKSPDCYRKLSMTINGMTPGPTIRAQQGDTIVVVVTNSLGTENVAIHWHGIRQFGTPWSDGAEGVTQCPILPAESFTYKFIIDQAGTFMYHGHYGMQRSAGLNGYHASTLDQAVGLASVPFVFVGEPQSLLINGRGSYNCSLLEPAANGSNSICNSENPNCTPFTLTVVHGKTYRLRIGSLTSLSTLSFQIEGHKMTVVEADGNYVEPFETENLYIYSGETYSVLVKADQPPTRNYWMTTSVVARKPATPKGLAIFNYYPNHPRRRPHTVPPAGPQWNDTVSRLDQSRAFKARKGYIHAPPPNPDRVIQLLNTQNKIGGKFKWALNNLSFALPTTPYLVALKQNLKGVFDQEPPPEKLDLTNYDIYSVAKNVNATLSNRIYRLEFNSTVEIVLQNSNTMTPNNSEAHPWHLHGHDFWVLAYGEGKYDPNRDREKYNLVDPIMKNTVPLHPYGWTAIRFRADNPGAWFFHCHIESHFFMGMALVFEEGSWMVGRLPSSVMGCGKTKPVYPATSP
ncbi:L-ascorbate oxidase [Linum perenne]